MSSTTDINYWSLLLGYGLLIIPIIILWYYKTGLVKDALWASTRMTIQLLLTGLYLEYFFKLNNPWLNLSWVLTMVFVAAFTAMKRSGLSTKVFIVPFVLASIVSLAITDIYFLGLVIKLNNIFDTRYFIPITGMLLGNTLKSIIVALSHYYSNLNSNKNTYNWYLANGASHREALLPFRREAMKAAFNPIIAATAVVGLISLPGMMTGQILGGSDPNVAIKYQIMLMITVFSTAIITTTLTIYLSDKKVFDPFGNLKKEAIKRIQ